MHFESHETTEEDIPYKYGWFIPILHLKYQITISSDFELLEQYQIIPSLNSIYYNNCFVHALDQYEVQITKSMM